MTLDHKYMEDTVFFAIRVKLIRDCVTCFFNYILLLFEHLTIKDLKEILEETVPTIVKSWENQKTRTEGSLCLFDYISCTHRQITTQRNQITQG